MDSKDTFSRKKGKTIHDEISSSERSPLTDSDKVDSIQEDLTGTSEEELRKEVGPTLIKLLAPAQIVFLILVYIVMFLICKFILRLFSVTSTPIVAVVAFFWLGIAIIMRKSRRR